MASWIDELRSRCGPLTDAATLFAANLGVEHDPPSGAAGLLALTRGIERHLDAGDHDEDGERLFIELAGAYLGVLLCGALPHVRHVSREGRHGLMFGNRSFFDPFQVIEQLLEAEDVGACLAEHVARAEHGARSAIESWDDVQDRLLPRLIGARLLDEVQRRAGVQPLFALPLASGVHVVLLLAERARRRYVDARELASWGKPPARVLQRAIANLAARSGAARLLRLESDRGVIVVARSGDGLDSSRLLLPGLHDVLGPELGSPFAAAVPHRDALLACSLACPDSVRLLAERAREEAARAAHPITPALLAVGPSGRLVPLPG